MDCVQNNFGMVLAPHSANPIPSMDRALAAKEVTKVIDIKRTYSNGLGAEGRRKISLRPDCECFNRSRSVRFFTDEEAERLIQKVIAKWYSPELMPYVIDGKVIVSNSKQNALIEYWRVCDPKDIGQPFTVTEMELPVNP